MIRLGIVGADGRMGARLCELAELDQRFVISARIDRDQPLNGTTSDLDLIIDFSSDEGAVVAIELAETFSAALLIGTTALQDETIATAKSHAETAPVMIAPNTSIGVAILDRIVAQTIAMTGDTFDIDLLEAHHTAKRDAPSGTAKRLIHTIERARGADLPPERVHVMRSGDIVGEHTIHLAGRGERLVLTHIATSRDVFVRGALRAAAWLVDQPPGVYGIEDVLRAARRA